MTTIQKNVYHGRSADQYVAEIYMTTPRGREIQRGLAKRPSLPPEEVQALMSELSGLASAAGQADAQRALDAGLFWEDPGPSQWPSTVFKADEDSAVGKSLRKALEAIR